LRYMPIILIVVALYIKLTLFLRHDLLLWPIKLSLIVTLAIWQTVKLLPINIFVGQLLDKRRDYGIDYGTIDLSAQFDL
jgi:hypothetical protein